MTGTVNDSHDGNAIVLGSMKDQVVADRYTAKIRQKVFDRTTQVGLGSQLVDCCREAVDQAIRSCKVMAGDLNPNFQSVQFRLIRPFGFRHLRTHQAGPRAMPDPSA